ncbi:hypothetical protein NQ176_g7808 [Zarea fungicola]|uniref:Uncharacterized protein n=1 Tax=Zarea fungicola TaxID=93591 RepID=A0ACC1MXW6_9HYPO|nr:hypothetical protein NQ176_g7808 [Lecanicillium fungicola]
MARADFELPRNIEYERKGPRVLLKKGLEGINIPPEKMEGVQAGGVFGGYGDIMAIVHNEDAGDLKDDDEGNANTKTEEPPM